MLTQLALVWAFHPILSDLFTMLGATGLGAVVVSISNWN